MSARSIRHLPKTATGRILFVFNVGTGIETYINELAELVIDAPGARVPVEHTRERSADFLRAKADLTLSRIVLGFEPKVRLAEGLCAYVEWCRFKEHCPRLCLGQCSEVPKV